MASQISTGALKADRKLLLHQHRRSLAFFESMKSPQLMLLDKMKLNAHFIAFNSVATSEQQLFLRLHLMQSPPTFCPAIVQQYAFALYSAGVALGDRERVQQNFLSSLAKKKPTMMDIAAAAARLSFPPFTVVDAGTDLPGGSGIISSPPVMRASVIVSPPLVVTLSDNEPSLVQSPVAAAGENTNVAAALLLEKERERSKKEGSTTEGDADTAEGDYRGVSDCSAIRKRKFDATPAAAE